MKVEHEKATDFDFKIVHAPPRIASERTKSIGKMFGIDEECVGNWRRDAQVKFSMPKGGVCYVTGPSGSNKSSVLNKIDYHYEKNQVIRMRDVDCSGVDSVIDSFDCELGEALRLLGKAGITDAFNLLQPVALLSDSQVMRYKMAKMLQSQKKIFFIDDFCAGMDGLIASVVACKLTRFARKEGLTLFLAGSRDDILADLRPDVVLICRNNAVEVITSEAL